MAAPFNHRIGPPAAPYPEKCSTNQPLAGSPEAPRDPRSVDRLHERVTDLVREGAEQDSAWIALLNILQAKLSGCSDPVAKVDCAKEPEEVSIGWQIDLLESQAFARREHLRKLARLIGDPSITV